MALSNLGLIQMGGAMLRPGGSLGDGFLAYGNGLQGDSQMQAQQIRTKLIEQQMLESQQDRQMKLQAAQQQQESMRRLMESLAPQQAAMQAPAPEPVASQGGLSGPLGSGTFGLDPLAVMAEKNLQTPAQASQTPQGQGSQWNELKFLLGMQAGLKREDIEALANSRNLGLPEVARTIDERDPRTGEPITSQWDKHGRRVGDGVRKPFELRSVNLDGQTINENPYSGQQEGSARDRVPFEYADASGTMKPGVLQAKTQVAKAGASNFTVEAGENLAKQVGEIMTQERNSLMGSIQLAQSAEGLDAALSSGKVFAGPGASAKMKLAQIGQVMGITGETTDELIVNTRATIKSLAQMDVQARKQLQGQGQITENEAKAVAKAEGGNIDDMTIPELKLLVGVHRKVARFKSKDYTEKLQNVPPALRPFYHVSGLESYLTPDAPTEPGQPEQPTGLPSRNAIAEELRRRSGGR